MLAVAEEEDTTAELRLSSQTAAELAGVSYRQLDYWCRTGVLKPLGYTRANGSGSRRVWGLDDVDIIRVVGRLARLGLEVEELTDVVVALVLDSGLLEAPWLYVATHGGRTVAAHGCSLFARDLPADGRVVRVR